MKFFVKRSILFLFILLAATQAYGTKRKVLFIGNSFTYVNNMPLMLQMLATSLGDTLVYEESDPGGYTLQQHSTYAPTLAKINAQQWDIVVLQEQSQLPSFPPSQVATDVYPYAHILDSLIHANDTCTQTLFLMTWGHANGDMANCAGYPAICTYDGMQARLRQSYMEMTQANHAIVAPVGAAWKVVRDSFPAMGLYQADNYHPLVPGSYLEACVLYNSIFHKKTKGSTYLNGQTAADAATLQRIADKVTLDSIAQWQQYGHYPYAGFRTTRAGNTVTMVYTPTIANGYSWHYGDGAGDTALSPTHTYTAAGTYTISHTTTTDCFTETQKDTITIATTGLHDAIADALPIITVQDGSGSITFTLPAGQVYDNVDVYDANGKCIRSYTLGARPITDRFVPGFYIYHAYSADRMRTYHNKLMIH